MGYQKKAKKLGDIIRFALYCVVSLPKTIYFNLITLPISSAFRLPILVGWNVKLVEVKGKCQLVGGQNHL